jgi:tetratricopeptide (TPR) repeat protein
MTLQDEQKLNIRKVLLAIIGGFITIEIFRHAISFALESRYGIDTDVYYMGRVRFSFVVILTIIISSFIGAFFAGSVTKKKGLLFGALLVIVPNSFLAAFAFISLSGKSLTPSGRIWLQHSIMGCSIWAAIQIVPCLFGGLMGERMVNRELREQLLYNEFEPPDNLEKLGLVNFYFGGGWRVLFTIPFLALCLYLFVYYIGDASLFLRWATIGAIYILVHPSLWLFWYIFPIWELLFGLLFTAIILPLYGPMWAHEIANKHIPRGKKVFQSAGLLLGIVVGTSLSSWLGHKPIIWSLNSVTSRGVSVWSILLDKETAPVTYHRLAIVHKEIGEQEKSAKEFEKAYMSYCDLGRNLIARKSYFGAIETYERAISISPKKSEPHYKLGIAYYMVSEYESAITEYNKAIVDRLDNFAINVNLALAYEKINGDNATEQWVKSLAIGKTSSVPEEITSWIYDYVYNPGKVSLTKQMESYFNKLELEN